VGESTARWLTPSAAADRLGIYPHELAKLVRDGKIPAPSRRLGIKRPRYDLEALDRAMADEGLKAVSYDEQVSAVAARIAAQTKGSPRSHQAARGRQRGSGLVLPHQRGSATGAE
jgi:hypothetical protein